MNRNRNIIVLITLFITTILLYMLIMQDGQISTSSGTLVRASSLNSSGFERALPAAEIRFPEDFGPHPEFQTEWWYYTGNLATDDGRRFGYQLTIFRRALVPNDYVSGRASDWGTTQIYMGHFAVTDVQADAQHSFEKFARDAAGLAGAQSVPYKVWLANWFISEISPNTYKLVAKQDGLAINLIMVDQKGPVLHGIEGYSQKGPEPGNASYYYSQTRLETTGTLIINEKIYPVTGFSWKDHEFSTSALSGNQVGWDWFALQLDDNTELKVFNIRRADGSIDPFSSGSYIDENANVIPLSISDFSIRSLSTWRSDRSETVYPSGWEISIPSLNLILNIRPLIKNQELNLSYSYWEGAVEFAGEKSGVPIKGYGYVELTGYAQSMAGEF